MRAGIAAYPSIPLRKAKSDRSLTLTRILFGELYEVLAEEDKWLSVRLTDDGMLGWMERKYDFPVEEDFVSRYRNAEMSISRNLFSLVCKSGEWEHFPVPAGSTFPFYDPQSSCFHLGDALYELKSGLSVPSFADRREQLVAYALMYYNALYLSGGLTPDGIDNSGLIQMAFRLSGIRFPRTLDQQQHQGETLSFLEEALPGDLIYFGDDSRITHAGILWEGGRIIHASGRVRIDKVDHHGIFHHGIKKYTHSLKLIKRVLPL